MKWIRQFFDADSWRRYAAQLEREVESLEGENEVLEDCCVEKDAEIERLEQAYDSLEQFVHALEKQVMA